MAYHETAFDAIFEDGLSDADLEEGEMAGDGQMDVDVVHGQSVDVEEGEVLFSEPPSAAAVLDEPEEHGTIEFGEFVVGLAKCESGESKDLGRRPRQKKPNKKRSGKRNKSVNVAQFVRDTCNHLQEKKYPLVWAAVKRLGVDGVRNLIKEVDVIERCGGQMTNDGKRRRTPGGVMWNILRSRVQPVVYKEIMSQGNEVLKEKDKKAKESLKRNRMDVEEPTQNKRLKLTVKDVDNSGTGASGKKVNQSRQPLKPSRKLLDVIEGPQKDQSTLPAVQLQKAWVEGIRKKENVEEASAVAPGTTLGADSKLLKVGTVLEKRPVAVFERLRVPVEYHDLVTEEKSLRLSHQEMPRIEHNHLLEATHSGDVRRQDSEQKGE